ncbi:HNH endonuclease signature motif containing protein, partial [Streptomyces sp. SID13031]|uniref:HNH endonuclease signature motif containing protein n=1 Tax=Streptomyces sp. SID13031 TaxID=2706046 RepID=UPI00194542FA
LDVGMDYRFVTRPIRRALIRRDKGCVICKAPPSHCHAHHIIHWADGGPTSITNLVLLCGGHHRAVHADHWAVKITNGVVQVTRPDWTVPTPGRLTMPSVNIPATPNSPTPPDAPWPSDSPATPDTPPWPDIPPTPGAARAPGALTLDGTAPGWFAPTTAAAAWSWSVSVNPDDPQLDRLRPTALTPANSPATGLSWLTPESVADLNPWGETGTPSTGP